jgi:hypothetical protein
VITDHEYHDHRTENLFPYLGGAAINMAALTFAFVGFVAGLFTMIIISLYKYVIKIMSH